MSRGGVIPVRYDLGYWVRGRTGGRPKIAGAGARNGAHPVGDCDVRVVWVVGIAASVIGEHPQRQPHAASGRLCQRIVDHVEVVLAVIRSVGIQRSQIGGL